MICTVDEEGDMTGSDHIVEQGFVKKEDYVLDLEPTDGEIQMAHKGRLWFHVHVKGLPLMPASQKKERMQYLQHQSLSYKYKKYLSIFQCMKNLATLPLPLDRFKAAISLM